MTDLKWKRKHLEDSDWDKHWYLDVNGFELILSQVMSNGSPMWKLDCLDMFSSALYIGVFWEDEIKAKEIAIQTFKERMDMRIGRYIETLKILNNVKEIPSQSDSDVRKFLDIIGDK